ncbi:K /cl-cotransporter protein 2 [Ditylenchus destructor]|uniref:K /cl-cotransporter protein 2 n=1 Tax=Ditylenchus destructor TaxID=166010 RepID=A0AAD4R7I8_9BILA|nr:K /cl-cotransporter protein 2 [Ditylenchus destructor]
MATPMSPLDWVGGRDAPPVLFCITLSSFSPIIDSIEENHELPRTIDPKQGSTPLFHNYSVELSYIPSSKHHRKPPETIPAHDAMSRFQVSSVTRQGAGDDENKLINTPSVVIDPPEANNQSSHVSDKNTHEVHPYNNLTANSDSGVAVGKNRENNGAERIPLVTSNKDELRNDKNDFNLALYEDEYNAQGQSIGKMLRSLSLYNSILPNAEDTESATSSSKTSQQPKRLSSSSASTKQKPKQAIFS